MRHNSKPFTLHIQPGWKAGTKLKFEDDGVAFEVTQAEHQTFSRRGNDLHIATLPASPLAIFTGATMDGALAHPAPATRPATRPAKRPARARDARV